MKKSLRSELKAIHQKEANRLARKVLHKPSGDYEAVCRTLKVYKELLSHIPLPWYQRVGLPIAIALICATVVGLGMSMPKTPTKVILSVQSSGMLAYLENNLTNAYVPNSNLTGELLTVSKITYLRLSPGIASQKPTKPPSTIHLSKGSVIVDKLILSPMLARKTKNADQQTSLEIQFHDKLFPTFSLRNGKVTISTRVSGDVQLNRDQSSKSDNILAANVIDNQLAETMEIIAEGELAKPAEVSLYLSDNSALLFRDIAVSDVRFIREVPSRTPDHIKISTIEAGNLTLPDTGKTIVLSPDVFLNLVSFKGRIREMRIADRMSILLEGTSSRVTLGPEGFERDLTPSYIEYLYHHQPLSLFWASLVFIWSLLWGATKLITGQK
ncbi:MAG: hypothetical protein PVF79_03850 [Desulfobacterales bacterium]|jgi:hypothetical protein